MTKNSLIAALYVLNPTLETEEEKQHFNQLIEEKLKEASVPQKTGILDKVGSFLRGVGVSIVDNVIGGLLITRRRSGQRRERPLYPQYQKQEGQKDGQIW